MNLPDLRGLVSKSLVVYEPGSKRYSIHELLSQYAEEKLDASGGANAIHDAHMDYFAHFMERLTPDIKATVSGIRVFNETPPSAAPMGTPEPDIIQFGYAFLRQYKTVWDFSESKIYLLNP